MFESRNVTLYREYSKFCSSMEPIGYLLFRVLFGIILMTHGLPKLLGTGHGSMANPMAGATRLIAEVLHLPGAPWIALFVAIFECVGGALLVVGFLTRPVAAMMSVQMVLICYIHREHFAWIDRGMEYPLVLLVGAILIACRGGASLSIDSVLSRRMLSNSLVIPSR